MRKVIKVKAGLRKGKMVKAHTRTIESTPSFIGSKQSDYNKFYDEEILGKGLVSGNLKDAQVDEMFKNWKFKNKPKAIKDLAESARDKAIAHTRSMKVPGFEKPLEMRKYIKSGTSKIGTSFSDTKVTVSEHGADVKKVLRNLGVKDIRSNSYMGSGGNSRESAYENKSGTLGSSTSKAKIKKYVDDFHANAGVKLKQMGFKRSGNSYTSDTLGRVSVYVNSARLGGKNFVGVNMRLKKKSYIDRNYHTSLYD